MSEDSRLGREAIETAYALKQLIVGPDGRHSHVERRINEAEAGIVRQVLHLSAAGHWVKAIAKTLNAEGAQSPRAQLGRSQTWAPSSVREVIAGFLESMRRLLDSSGFAA